MQDRKRITDALLKSNMWFLLWTILLIPSNAQKIPFDNYTNQNGLPQITVNAISQDHDGYIWFATQVGAARYDGYTYEHVNLSNGLPDDEVNCLHVDGEGKIWFGTFHGELISYDGEIFEELDLIEGMRLRINSI